MNNSKKIENQEGKMFNWAFDRSNLLIKKYVRWHLSFLVTKEPHNKKHARIKNHDHNSHMQEQ